MNNHPAVVAYRLGKGILFLVGDGYEVYRVRINARVYFVTLFDDSLTIDVQEESRELVA